MISYNEVQTHAQDAFCCFFINNFAQIDNCKKNVNTGPKQSNNKNENLIHVKQNNQKRPVTSLAPKKQSYFRQRNPLREKSNNNYVSSSPLPTLRKDYSQRTINLTQYAPTYGLTLNNHNSNNRQTNFYIEKNRTQNILYSNNRKYDYCQNKKQEQQEFQAFKPHLFEKKQQIKGFSSQRQNNKKSLQDQRLFTQDAPQKINYQKIRQNFKDQNSSNEYKNYLSIDEPSNSSVYKVKTSLEQGKSSINEKKNQESLVFTKKNQGSRQKSAIEDQAKSVRSIWDSFLHQPKVEESVVIVDFFNPQSNKYVKQLHENKKQYSYFSDYIQDQH